jgi:CubicO group peptidase (beta-lactamase class C family)
MSLARLPTLPMDDITSLLVHQIDSELCTGGQVARTVGGEVEQWCAGADGLGQPIGHDTVAAIYCASKPALAFAVRRLAAKGALPTDATMGELVDVALGAPDATVFDLLNHTAGVHSADGETLKLYGRDAKRGIAMAASAPPGWSADRDAAYSEYMAWALLAEAIESVADLPWPAVVAELVLEPAGVEGRFVPVFEQSSFHSEIDRVRVNIDLRDRAVPLLNERGQSFACEPIPGYGAFASAAGLAQLVHRHLTDPTLAVSALSGSGARRGYRWDDVMHLRGDMQEGLMADLASYGVLGASPRSIGHTGLMGLTTVIHEPGLGETTAITYFGLIDGPTATQVRRPAMLEALGFATSMGREAPVDA